MLLSARGPGVEEEARAAGATTFLRKPILGSALMMALRAFLPGAKEPTAPDVASAQQASEGAAPPPR